MSKCFEQRKEESRKIMDKHPNRLPVIVESKDITLDKHKYLVPKNLTIGEFIQVLRKRINIKAEEAIFLLINNKSPMINSKMEDLYESERGDCGFLFISVTRESVFGN